MKSVNILVSMPMHEAYHRKLTAMPGVNVRMVEPDLDGIGRSYPREAVEDREVFFASSIFPNWQDMKGLKWVQICSSGYGAFFGLGLPEKGIRATHGKGVFDVSIGEWCLTMMLMFNRAVPEMLRNQQQSRWDRNARQQRELRGTTVGFWGYGGLARHAARLAKSVGQNVHVLVRNGVKRRENVYVIPGTGDPEGVLPDRVFNMDQRDEFLAGLDFLILAMPLTKTNEGIVGEAVLRALPERAYVLNPARGTLIQEQVLLKALREGWIAGAALDTHFQYPLPQEHPLWLMPNVILTPHIAGSESTQTFFDNEWDVFTQNVERYLAGRPLLNELTTAQLRGE